MVSEAEKRRVGALIRHRRQVLGLKQPEFAERVGVSRNAVSKVENGKSYPLRWAGKAEAVLGITFSEPEPRLDFDPANQDEATIASWDVFTVEERQQKIYELRERKRRAPRIA